MTDVTLQIRVTDRHNRKVVGVFNQAKTVVVKAKG